MNTLELAAFLGTENGLAALRVGVVQRRDLSARARPAAATAGLLRLTAAARCALAQLARGARVQLLHDGAAQQVDDVHAAAGVADEHLAAARVHRDGGNLAPARHARIQHNAEQLR